MSRTLLFALIASVLTLAPVTAQSPQATISGVISDIQGAVVPATEITATNRETGVKTTTRSNEVGFYSLRFLPIGDYTVTVEHSGFRRYVRDGIALTTGQSLELNITLELGQTTESVTVSAVASTLETTTSETSQLVEAKTIEDMPLGDRRSMNMIRIMPGAVFVGYDAGLKPNFSLAGGRTQSQMYWIDGGSGQNMRLGIGQFDFDPPVGALQEVRIISNNYSAEYGGSNGGVIVATTKSGTNRFQGEAYEYLRNDKLDAPNFFAPVSGTQKVKAPLRYNVFGATIGGRIRRDKAFFFFGYEGSRRRDGSVRTLTVPTDLQKAGDFSQTFNARGAAIPVYDPATTRPQGNTFVRDPFPGNVIPGNRMDPVALNLLPFYPAPNRPPDNITGANNFRSNAVLALTRNNYVAKVDYNLSEKDKFNVRYFYNADTSVNSSVFPNPAADTVNDPVAHQNNISASWVRTLSSTAVNELRFTYGNRFYHQTSKGLGGDWPGKVGIKGVTDNAFPQIIVTGVTDLSNNAQERRQYPITQTQYVENFTLIRARHALKFGIEFRRSGNYEVNLPTASGAFTFNTLPSGQPNVAASGIGMATLLLGFTTNFAAQQTQILDRHSWYLAGFFQDDWSVNKDLTLNLGLRWETDTPMVDSNNRMNGFDPAAINPVSGTPGVVTFAGLNGWRTSPYDTDWNNFGPRLGFAWKPLGSTRTVVRGGYGIFYAHPFDRGVPNAASLGFQLSASASTPDNGITAPFYLKNGTGLDLQPPALGAGFGAVPVGKTANQAPTFFETNRRSGYSQQFNFGIQHELPRQVILEASYLGNLGRKLASANISINQIRPELLGPAATQKDRPFPQFNNVSIIAPTFGVSSYHAGILRAEKRFAAGLNFLASYTWSKFIDNVDEAGSALGNKGGAYSNYYNRRADRGPSENDIRQRFAWSSVWELPVGSGKRYLAHHPARFVLGGWNLGAVVTLQSGPPFTVTTQVNTTNAFSAGNLRADILRNPNLSGGQRNLGRWFDTDAFAQPAPFTFGGQGVDILRADGVSNFDFSILRNFPISEQRRFQFRGELFNAFNHPTFGIPGRVFGGPGFGVVSSANAARVVQLGLRFVY